MRVTQRKKKYGVAGKRRRSDRNFGKRLFSLLLGLSLVLPLLCNFCGLVLSSAALPMSAEYIMNRIADSNTMDDYLKHLLSSEWGSRYAGRIWTDKSVFAFDPVLGTDWNKIGLDMATDGYTGEVGFSADFAHVFSALASSQVVNEWPPSPIDMVLVLDISSSMMNDTIPDKDSPFGQARAELAEYFASPEGLEELNRGGFVSYYESHLSDFDGMTLQEAAAAQAMEHTRYTNLIYSADRVITNLMANNKENRVAVVVYDRQASVVMPLAHYEPNTVPISQMEGSSYYDYKYLEGHPGETASSGDRATAIISKYLKDLTFGYLCPYFDGHGADTGRGHPTCYVDVSAKVEVVADPVEEVETRGVEDDSSNEIKRISGTNTHAGITAGFEQLADAAETTFSAKLSSGTTVTVPRIPAAIVMTDGGSNTVSNGPWYDPDWGNAVQRNDNQSSWSSVVDTQYLLTASYLKSAVEKNYSSYMAYNGGGQEFAIYTVGVDLRDDSDAWVPERLYPMMDPEHYFKEESALPDHAESPNADLGVVEFNSKTIQHIAEAYNDWLAWTAGEDAAPYEDFEVVHWSSTSRVPKHYFQQEESNNQYPIPFEQDQEINKNNWNPDGFVADLNTYLDGFNLTWHGWKDLSSMGSADVDVWREAGVVSDETAIWGRAVYRSFLEAKNEAANGATGGAKYAAERTVTFTDNVSMEEVSRPVEAVTQADVTANVNYVAQFYNVTSSQVDSIFEQILTAVIGQVFVPIGGVNESGVSDSITYQDPLGEYMEIKNEAISATPHHVDDPTVGETGAQTYDMAMLVFGEMHGLVRAGVYDWNWNDKWMSLNRSSQQGEAAFPMGWYKGEPREGQEKLADEFIRTDSDGSSTYPWKDPDTGKEYKSAQDARNDGWVYRFNFATMLQFVPINTGISPDVHPSDLPAQIKNTVYTCYRFAGTQKDRNALKRNPIFEEGVPADILAYWEQYYKDHGSYPATSESYAGIPGVYRLSDIRVWVEEYGDFVDTEGAITPNQGYDRSLYLNIPAAAVPTQLAMVTLNQDGVRSYETNLGEDHPEEAERYYAQSTPLRLFYAVGLEENLILRDEGGNQIGVDFSKISAEYITDHTVEERNSVWFISNYYSNTTYDNYVTDSVTSRTRGDPTMTFSPSKENRYYIFQKPLPMYAHAYRESAEETLEPVDNTEYWRHWPDGLGEGDWDWNSKYPHGGGNGETTWENGSVGGGSWTGGEYMGTYINGQTFEEKKTEALSNPDTDGKYYITDDHGTKYLYNPNGIVFLEADLLDHVTSEAGEDGGYTDDSVFFESDDYFFILLEYYVPDKDVPGVDEKGQSIPGAYGGRMVQYVVARRGSEFGSGFVSEKINNGDMLCWTPMDKGVDLQFDYLSKSGTGDLTRGEPTWQKLTFEETALRDYLENVCGIDPATTMPNPDYNPDVPEDDSNPKTVSVLEHQVEYWLSIRENAQLKTALAAADTDASGSCEEGEFKAAFHFAVATKPGGIRSGNMANNLHTRGSNVTGTAWNYYVPVVSDNSGIGDEAILNSYMGNNGYLEIANEMLHVTKMLELPEGFFLNDRQKNEEFNFQIYVQGLTGTRNAILTQYNEFGKVWERQLAYIDVLTDNSDLVLDNNSNRALFVSSRIEGSLGSTQTATMVATNGDEVWPDGSPVYYKAAEDGSLPRTESGEVDVTQRVEQSEQLYYLYLPPIKTDSETTQHVRRLYQNKEYDGREEGYAGPYAIDSEAYDKMFRPNGVTTFVDSEHSDLVTDTTPGAANRDSYRLEVENRPAGSRTYWAQDAELIPQEEVLAAEASNDTLGSDPGLSAYATEAVTAGMWVHPLLEDGDTCPNGNHIGLTYYNLFIRRPEEGTSATAFESPLKSRSAYMTVELNFGTNGNEGDGGENGVGTALTPDDLYDKALPVGRTAEQVAANTAEVTLKHGEGLLITGLDDKVPYRFTELLTPEQLQRGYLLKEIEHIQEAESQEVYHPEDENGVYSVTGDTGWFEEQAHYVNTVDPDLLVLTKDLVDLEGKDVPTPPEKKFEFKLTLTPSGKEAMTDADGKFYYWKGKKADLGKAAEAGGPPTLEEYTAHLEELNLAEPVEGVYLFELKADEAVVIYGIPAEMGYTVEETPAENYPAVDGETHTEIRDDYYKQTGTVKHHADDRATVTNPEKTENRADFYNQKATGSLTVQKKIADEGADKVEKEFGFTVELTPAENASALNKKELTATKYRADGKVDPDFTYEFTEIDEDGDGVPDPGTGLRITFKLKHGEQVVLEGLPFGTKFKVSETDREGYNLQHVADNLADNPTDGHYLPITDGSVEGTVTRETPQTYTLFSNAKPAELPFTGSYGLTTFYALGALILLAGTAVAVKKFA